MKGRRSLSGHAIHPSFELRSSDVRGCAFESLLAGVEPSDPLTYVVAAAMTGLMVLSGTVAPALRALRVDPVTALRAE